VDHTTQKEEEVTKRCPHCNLEMEHVEDEPDVGIVGGWHCEHCDKSFDDRDDYYEEPDDWKPMMGSRQNEAD
jgi:transposase-like protein